MNTRFFLGRFWPTIVLIFMSTAYVTGVTYGMTTSGALITAAWTGFAALLVAVSTIVESGGRNRMVNLIALWTTFFMALAPAGPAVFVPLSPLVFASALFIIGMFIAAVSIAYLLERFIIAGRHGTWYIEHGLAPLGVVLAAGLEVGSHHMSAIAILAFYWFIHFFYKQIPQLLASVGIKPLQEGG